MDIVSIGGGPAGLFFAILMKLRAPATRIRVIERNRADDTFGWGVVFSDETLGNIAAADPVTYELITQAFAHWTDIDIHYQGQVLAHRAWLFRPGAAEASQHFAAARSFAWRHISIRN